MQTEMKQDFCILLLENILLMICKRASLVASCFDTFSDLEFELSLDRLLLMLRKQLAPSYNKCCAFSWTVYVNAIL